MHEPRNVEINGKTIQLDWVPRFDERSLAYTVSSKLNTHKRVRNRHWTKNVILDQGAYYCPICRQYGACVGYSCLYVLMTTPRLMTIKEGPTRANLDKMSHRLYHGAQYHDQWQGQFETYEGSSVLGAMQYLKSVGAIPRYLWCTTLLEMQVAVSNYGPLMIGIDWDWNMFEPNSKGVIMTGGGNAGGHAIEVIGVDFNRELFELPNTWGTKFGINGSVWLPFAEMEKLRRRRGEFALMRKPFLGRTINLPAVD